MNFDLISLFTGVGGLSLGAWLASKRIKLSNGLTVVSETQPQVKKNSFVKESRDLVNQIAYAGVECHAVKSICYKSKWTSEYDSDITCTLLVYSRKSFEFELFIKKFDVIKTMISFESPYSFFIELSSMSNLNFSRLNILLSSSFPFIIHPCTPVIILSSNM